MLAFIVGCAVVYGIIPHLDAVSDPVTNKIPLADRVAYNGLHRWVKYLTPDNHILCFSITKFGNTIKHPCRRDIRDSKFNNNWF